MEYVILGLLTFRSLTIYDINSEFKQGISLFYSASYGSIQTAIKKLLSKGFIDFHEVVENGRNKKIYSICDEGSDFFLRWMKSDIAHRNNESIISTKVYFLGLMEKIEDKRRILHDIISIYEELQHELSLIKERVSTIDLKEEYKDLMHYQMKSLDHGLVSYNASLAFYRDLLKELS